MTCWSCYHYRRDGCDILRAGWPEVGVRCSAFEYDPGSDEPEWDRLLDVFVESILSASDEEILEDILLEGRCLDQVADSVRDAIRDVTAG